MAAHSTQEREPVRGLADATRQASLAVLDAVHVGSTSEGAALRPERGDALIIVDVQNDFLPGGALPARKGDEVIAPLNRVIAEFHRRGLPIYATRDWHPTDHCSFRLQGGPWPPSSLWALRAADAAGAAFLVAAGLEQALEYLGELRFTAEELEFLAREGSFPQQFLDYLGTARFTGTVHAMPEGTPFFAGEPILRVTAPIIEAQLLESRLLNIIHFQTLIASKAARCVIAAKGRRLADYGMRRSHEGDAALFAARAAYLAGCDATATVEAGRRFGIPIVGTMAHSFIETHDDEEEAFRHFTRARPGRTTLLIDTYDTRDGAAKAARLGKELRGIGSTHGVDAVRIDSGDLGAEAHAVRKILDDHGCRDVKIVLSGGLDEHQIEALVSSGVPVDVFGVGTSLAVSADAPALDMAYKLQMYAGKPRRKRSPGKATCPGAKQVLREFDADGMMSRDWIVLDGERADGSPLLAEAFRQGRVIAGPRRLDEIRNDCRAQLRTLPATLLSLDKAPAGSDGSSYPVVLSAALEALAATADSALR